MSYSKNWTFLNNIDPQFNTSLTDQQKSFFLAIRDILKVAGWTAISSSNGVAYSPSSDQLTTPGNLVYANSQAANRSWVLLKSPIGFVAGPDGSYLGEQSRMFIVLECYSIAVIMGFSISSAFNVNFYAAVGAGAAVNAIPAGGISSIGQFSTNTRLLHDANTPQKYYFGYTDKGGVYAACKQVDTGIITAFFYVLPLANVGKYGLIDYPYAAICGCMAYSATGNLAGDLFDKYSGATMFNHNGSAGAPRAIMPQSVLAPTYTIGAGATADINGDVIRSNIRIFNSVSGIADVGDVPDFYLTGNNNGYGVTTPISGAIEHTSAGRLFIPNNITI
jgi:hypothetical protein